VFDALSIRPVLAINGSALAAYPAIVRAARDRGWEFMGHGFTQRNMQKVEDERADIRKTRAVIAEATSAPPRGWLGPGLTETWDTPDLLVEEGYDYIANWVLDDQPVWLKTRTKPLLNVPYTQECNRHDADPAPQGVRIQRPRAGPVRTDLRRCRHVGPRHGFGRAPLHHGRTAPAEVFPPRTRNDAAKERRDILDRRTDHGLVSIEQSADRMRPCESQEGAVAHMIALLISIESADTTTGRLCCSM
jgi:hypothetical protein